LNLMELQHNASVPKNGLNTKTFPIHIGICLDCMQIYQINEKEDFY